VGLPPGVRGLLLDVEGTTTPIDFVQRTLFPYARERLDAWCAKAAHDPRVAEALARLRAEHAAEPPGAAPGFDDGARYARWLIDQDRKSTGLKLLQGLIWETGYLDGELRAPVFPDVPRALVAWRTADRAVRIFSSGSVLAQQLLFAHTDRGDLTPWIDGYHDTTTGPKAAAASYLAIAAAFDLPPEAVLFLGDAVAELDAARGAGLLTGQIERPGNPPAPEPGHTRYRDFAALMS